MRREFLLSAALMAAIAALAASPAQAHGDLVALPEAYAPGTIVVKTGERHLSGQQHEILKLARRD